MELTPVNRWVILGCGFQQRLGHFNGMELLWNEVDHLVSGRGTRVEIFYWNDPMDTLAKRIQNFSPKFSHSDVIIFSYSWWTATAVNLAKRLKGRGIRVKHIVTSDGVHRHWRWTGRWRTFFPDAFPLWIPDNVDEVTQFRQRQSWPSGHVIKAVNPGKTIINPVQWLDADHCSMDRHPEFHKACLRVLREVAK